MEQQINTTSAPPAKKTNSVATRLILIYITLAIMFTIGAATYFLYNNNETELKFDDIESKNKTVDASGVFEGQFRSKRTAWVLTDFEYYIKDDDLYITMLATSGEREPLAADADGYSHIRIETGFENIDKVYYIYGEKKVSLNIKKK